MELSGLYCVEAHAAIAKQSEKWMAIHARSCVTCEGANKSSLPFASWEMNTRVRGKMKNETRCAVVSQESATLETVGRYLPSNYSAELVAGQILITGIDVSGWTLDSYVLPRLASGMIFAKEVK